jgi:hypothetical protein
MAWYLSEKLCLVVRNPAIWRELVLTKKDKREEPEETYPARKLAHTATLAVNQGDKPGGERCAVWRAVRETGVQSCIPFVDGEQLVLAAIVRSETGTGMGSSYPAVKCDKSNKGALIKLKKNGAASQCRSAELERSPVCKYLSQKCK